MAKATPATVALERAGFAFKLHEYAYDPKAERTGLQAAAALGVSPGRLFKTLMVRIGADFACALVPSDQQLNLKRLAAAAGAKHAELLPVALAERVSGYHVGGISPFAQRRRIACYLDTSALTHASVLVNAGRRGLQIELAPGDLLRLLAAVTSELC
jgi:Cys-tRNA(Pro)/Cys-tRNA(Cys) deacylase